MTTTSSLTQKAVSFFFADTASIARKDAMKQAHKATKHVVSIMKASYSEVLRDALFVVYSIVKRCEALRIVEVHFANDKNEIEVVKHNDEVVYTAFQIDQMMLQMIKVKKLDVARCTRLVVQKAFSAKNECYTFDLDMYRSC